MKWDYSIGCCVGVSGRENRERTRAGGNNKGERIRMNEGDFQKHELYFLPL